MKFFGPLNEEPAFFLKCDSQISPQFDVQLQWTTKYATEFEKGGFTTSFNAYEHSTSQWSNSCTRPIIIFPNTIPSWSSERHSPSCRAGSCSCRGSGARCGKACCPQRRRAAKREASSSPAKMCVLVFVFSIVFVFFIVFVFEFETWICGFHFLSSERSQLVPNLIVLRSGSPVSGLVFNSI